MTITITAGAVVLIAIGLLLLWTGTKLFDWLWARHVYEVDRQTHKAMNMEYGCTAEEYDRLVPRQPWFRRRT